MERNPLSLRRALSNVRCMAFPKPIWFVLLLISCSQSFAGDADGPGFLYTGTLKTNVPNVLPPRQELANGPCDFEFRMFDNTGGTNLTNQIGTTVTKTNVTCSNGVFRVRLDFGNVAYGKAGFLEIAVRPTYGVPFPPSFEKLSPLQAIPTVPLAEWTKRGGSETWRTLFRDYEEYGPIFQSWDDDAPGGLQGGVNIQSGASSPLGIINFPPSNRAKQIDTISFFLTVYEYYPVSATATANLQAEVRRLDGTIVRTNSLAPILLSSNVHQWVAVPLDTNVSAWVVQSGEVLSLAVRYVSGSESLYFRLFGEAVVRDPD